MDHHLKTVVAVLPSPNVMSVNISENGAVKLGEVEGKFLQVVLDALGTEYDVVFPKDRSFGTLLPDGSWTGMVGMVHRGEADLAFTYLSITEERTKVVNFSTYYTTEVCVFVTRMPEIIKSAFSFLYPFDLATWMAILLTLGLVAISFAKFQNQNYSVFEIIFRLIANFSKQISMPEDRSLKYKIVLLNWLLFATVISLSYSATLLSFLVQPLRDATIRTFTDASKAVQRGTHTATIYDFSLPFLLNSEDDDLKVLGRIVAGHKWFEDISLRESGSQFRSRSIHAVNRNTARLLFGNRNDLHIAEDTLYVTPMAFAYGRKFCCPSKLNSILLRLSGAGLYDKILQENSLKMFLETSRKSQSLVTKSALYMTDLLGVFMLFGIGMVFSFGVFLGEVVFRTVCALRK
ncbi:Glutamate receptor ionotropic, delta-1 [Araneus ventricosus]|uniref:Glutamate receptor ionotropic, delta-1 n=1 Tax=Araneus ventricosus TaxID=182803 RepID=A0A4Y2JCY4_ARAVE|nr:Glutamate receptor ionotropic, delta-1 [Araneus ventricosus]